MIQIPPDFHLQIKKLQRELKEDPANFVPVRQWWWYNKTNNLMPFVKESDDDFSHKTSLQRHYLKNRLRYKQLNHERYKRRVNKK